VAYALREIKDTGTDQERCSNEQKPCSGCQYRSLHFFLNLARTSAQVDPIVLGKECSE
jgi:hypothetical protein